MRSPKKWVSFEASLTAKHNATWRGSLYAVLSLERVEVDPKTALNHSGRIWGPTALLEQLLNIAFCLPTIASFLKRPYRYSPSQYNEDPHELEVLRMYLNLKETA